MTRRTELPWPDIQREVARAVEALAAEEGSRPFVANVKFVADHIIRNRHLYPTIGAVSEKAIKGRCTMAMNRMGWERWTSGKSNGDGMKFVIPWDEKREGKIKEVKV